MPNFRVTNSHPSARGRVRLLALSALALARCASHPPPDTPAPSRPTPHAVVVDAAAPVVLATDAASDSTRAVILPFEFRVITEITFDANSATIVDRELENIATVATFLQLRRLVVLLEGRIATTERASHLGMQRARALRDALVRLGVDPRQLQVVDLAHAKPLDGADSPRVTFRVLYDPADEHGHGIGVQPDGGFRNPQTDAA